MLRKHWNGGGKRSKKAFARCEPGSVHPTISSSVVPFSSCPQSFPASGSFQINESALRIRWPNTVILVGIHSDFLSCEFIYHHFWKIFHCYVNFLSLILFLVTLHSVQDLSFLTRKRTHDPCNGSRRQVRFFNNCNAKIC